MMWSKILFYAIGYFLIILKGYDIILIITGNGTDSFSMVLHISTDIYVLLKRKSLFSSKLFGCHKFVSDLDLTIEQLCVCLELYISLFGAVKFTH